jgi:hypothetical protein
MQFDLKKVMVNGRSMVRPLDISTGAPYTDQKARVLIPGKENL